MDDHPPFAIREACETDTASLVAIIRESFQDVARRFDLTAQNCPKHPSNCRESWIQDALSKGIRYFLLASSGTPCGCVAFEQADEAVSYLERLAVLPGYRRHGYGQALVNHVLQEAKSRNVYRIDIGIIAAQTELKAWYQKIGFLEQKTASFPHLPFKVLFMSLPLGGAESLP